ELAASDTPLAASDTPELDADWDFVCGQSYRPDRASGCSGNPLGGTSGRTLYQARRTEPITRAGNWPPELPTAEAVKSLRAYAEASAGSAHRTPIDREWWEIDAADGNYDDQAFLANGDPRAYPTYSSWSPWSDTDGDGIDDAWEQVACPGSSPWCSPYEIVPKNSATKPACAGYRWVQCWAHLDDFGEEVAQVEPDSEVACVPTGPVEGACSDGIDNDCDGYIDFPTTGVPYDGSGD